MYGIRGDIVWAYKASYLRMYAVRCSPFSPLPNVVRSPALDRGRAMLAPIVDVFPRLCRVLWGRGVAPFC